MMGKNNRLVRMAPGNCVYFLVNKEHCLLRETYRYFPGAVDWDSVRTGTFPQGVSRRASLYIT